MIPSSLSTAKSDPRLRGAALAAYVFALEYLDTVEFRPLKVEVLASAIRCKKMTAVDALRRLVDAGYLARGLRPHGEARQYRVLPSPRPLPHSSATVKHRAA